jgi:DNA-directed RNA polymerase subunit RPC12/RpoP
MAETAYFSQECPTCGRSLHIRVEYLGRKVVCQHCRGSLVAQDPAIAGALPSDSSLRLMQRADELLERVERTIRPR